MLAAAAFAEGSGPPPEEWQIWSDWQFFGLSPEAGGLNDQPAGLLDRIRAVLEIMQAVQSYRKEGTQAGQMAAWKQAHPAEARLIRQIEDLRRHGLD